MKDPNKSFEQLLNELDEMIKADLAKFREELMKLSVRENTDNYFENEESLINEFENPVNFTNLAENQANLSDLNEDSRQDNYGQSRVADQ
jgi:hypothetical protein